VDDKRIGDAPIEMSYREAMNNIAAALDRILNGKDLSDRKSGFVLLVFPFNDKSGRCNYISNGADRNDIVRMLKEQIRQFEAQNIKEVSPDEDGMTKINDVLHMFAAGQISREECVRQLVSECSVSPLGMDGLLDTYDPAKKQ
jgi:hypothetical protein